LSSKLGGDNTKELIEDAGPWNDYEIVDGDKPDDVVGIRKIGEENATIFTLKDLAKLPNHSIPEEFRPKLEENKEEEKSETPSEM